jgi:hypothetical protein
MNKPEYGDLYKFVASIGVVLISLALLFPWLLLRESFDALHKVSEIAELPQTAQQLLAYRQNTALWWVKNVHWFSIILSIFGLAFLCIGVTFWRPKQIVIDTKEQLEVQKLAKELIRMTPEEIAVNKIEEAAEQAQARVKEAGAQEIIPPSEVKQAVSEAFRIEEVITEKLRQCLFSQGEVFNNRQIGLTKYDTIFSSTTKELNDVAVKVKYTSTSFVSSYIKTTIARYKVSLRLYKETTNREVLGLLIFAYEAKTNIDQKELEDAKKEVNPRVYFMTPEEIEQLSCPRLKQMIIP